MKRFLIRTLLWFIISILTICIVDTIYFYSGFINKNTIGHEVKVAIKNSKDTSYYRYVILGDSVGLQFYNSWTNYDNLISLASNRGISLAGQFFLLNNYIDCHRNSLPDEVILVITYQSLVNELTSDLSYPYFLKNFYRSEYLPLYNEPLWFQVKKTPFYWTSWLPVFRTSNFAFHYSVAPSGNHILISPITESYLREIEKITEDNHISFRLVIAPIRESGREAFLSTMHDGYLNGELDDTLLVRALNEVEFFPDSMYYDDVHFNDDDIPVDFLHLLEFH